MARDKERGREKGGGGGQSPQNSFYFFQLSRGQLPPLNPPSAIAQFSFFPFFLLIGYQIVLVTPGYWMVWTTSSLCCAWPTFVMAIFWVPCIK